MSPEQITGIVQKHSGNGGLVAILQDIQARFGYLPQDALKIVANRTGRALTDIYGVATFYRSFTLQPRGKHLCSVCLGTACHVRGGPAIAQELEKQLRIKAGATTPDGEFTLEAVNCLGACALGPIVVVDGHYFSNVTKAMVGEILAKAREGLDKVQVKSDERVFPLEVSCARCNHSLMDTEHPVDGYPSIRVTVSFGQAHEYMWLSSLYGSFTVECEQEIPAETVIDFFCPHCHAHMVGWSNCPDCEAPMIPMMVRGGGIVQICARKGCRDHILDVSGPVF